MSPTLVPTESTTDSLDTIPVFGSTANQASEQAIVNPAAVLLEQAQPEFEAWFQTLLPEEPELSVHVYSGGDPEQPADQLLQWWSLGAAADQALPRTEHFLIDDLGEAGYHVLQPIPVEIRRVGIGDFEASFREANIAISGSDQDDAYQALVAEILETFDVLLTEQNLGPDATEQCRILLTYIVRA